MGPGTNCDYTFFFQTGHRKGPCLYICLFMLVQRKRVAVEMKMCIYLRRTRTRTFTCTYGVFFISVLHRNTTVVSLTGLNTSFEAKEQEPELYTYRAHLITQAHLHGPECRNIRRTTKVMRRLRKRDKEAECRCAGNGIDIVLFILMPRR